MVICGSFEIICFLNDNLEIALAALPMCAPEPQISLGWCLSVLSMGLL